MVSMAAGVSRSSRDSTAGRKALRRGVARRDRVAVERTLRQFSSERRDMEVSF
jgi:hypothetical protein